MGNILAWHFLQPNGKLAYDEPLLVEAGYVYSIADHEKPELCVCGMHASIRAIDALYYAKSTIISRVIVSGNVQFGKDKLCGRHREVLCVKEVSLTLHEFAVWCVRNTPLPNGKTTWSLLTDPRSRAAVVAKEQWLRGEITDKQLAKVSGEAWHAASPANWSSNCANYYAAQAAAKSAVSSSASGVSRAAAGGASWAAVWAAARGGRWHTAQKAQANQLESMLLEVVK